METVRLWLSDYSIYTYPDVMVIKGQPLYQGNSQSNVINPLIIVEVLSNSTKLMIEGISLNSIVPCQLFRNIF